jgi:hypothetical protein
MTAVDELIALFNRHSMDLPDGFFSRQTQFVLNGIPFEERMGRSPSDPLVLMLTRGPAGYRFAAKAVQHAVPDAALQRGELSRHGEGAEASLSGQAWLSGHLRGTGEAIEILIDVDLQLRGDTAVRVAATLAEDDLACLRDARGRA